MTCFLTILPSKKFERHDVSQKRDCKYYTQPNGHRRAAANDQSGTQKHGDIDSLIPVLVHTRGMTVQQAIDDTTKELQLSVDRFDRTAKILLDEVESTSPELADKVASFIKGCRYNLTANLLWRYVEYFRSCFVRRSVSLAYY